jgi:hypothetical protein
VRFTYVAAERSSCELSECVQTGSLREWFIIDVKAEPESESERHGKARVNRKYYTKS